MKTLNRIRTLSLILVALLAIPPIVSAVLPVLIWTNDRDPTTDFINFQGQSTYDTISTSNYLKLEVEENGRVAWNIHLTDSGALQLSDDTTLIYETTGSTLERHDTRCASSTGTDTCQFRAHDWDRALKYWVIASEDHAQAGTTQASHPATPGEACTSRVNGSATAGSICSMQWNITALTSPSTTADVDAGGITSWKRNATSMGLMANNEAYLWRIPTLFSGSREFQLSSTTDKQLFSNKTGPIGWATSQVGSTITYRRFNYEAGSLTHTATGPNVLSNTGRMSPNGTNEIIYAYATSLTSGVIWDRIPMDDLAPIDTVTPSDNRIWFDGALRNMNVADFDTDESGNILVCGQFATGSETNGYVLAMNMTTRTQLWNVTIDLGTFTESRSCQFDYNGGFYVSLIYQNGGGFNLAQLRRYEGGGFAQPEPPETIQLPLDEDEPDAIVPGADGGLGFSNFCIAIGFSSGPGKFLCGLAIVVSGTLLIVVITRDLNKKAIMVTGLVTALGLSIFVTIVSLWPVIALALMVVLAAAAIAAMAKGVFASGA